MSDRSSPLDFERPIGAIEQDFDYAVKVLGGHLQFCIKATRCDVEGGKFHFIPSEMKGDPRFEDTLFLERAANGEVLYQIGYCLLKARESFVQGRVLFCQGWLDMAHLYCGMPVLSPEIFEDESANLNGSNCLICFLTIFEGDYSQVSKRQFMLRRFCDFFRGYDSTGGGAWLSELRHSVDSKE